MTPPTVDFESLRDAAIEAQHLFRKFIIGELFADPVPETVIHDQVPATVDGADCLLVSRDPHADQTEGRLDLPLIEKFDQPKRLSRRHRAIIEAQDHGAIIQTQAFRLPLNRPEHTGTLCPAAIRSK
jgi:hypothetical protein